MAAGAALRGLDAPNALRQLGDMLEAARKADSRECAETDKRIVRQLERTFEDRRDVAAVHLASRLHKEKSFEIASRQAIKHNCTSAGERIAQLAVIRDAPIPRQEVVLEASIAAAVAAAQSVAHDTSSAAAAKAVEAALSKHLQQGGLRAAASGSSSSGQADPFLATTSATSSEPTFTLTNSTGAGGGKAPTAPPASTTNAPVSFTGLKSSSTSTSATAPRNAPPIPFSRKRNANEVTSGGGLDALVKSPERGSLSGRHSSTSNGGEGANKRRA